MIHTLYLDIVRYGFAKRNLKITLRHRTQVPLCPLPETVETNVISRYARRTLCVFDRRKIYQKVKIVNATIYGGPLKWLEPIFP